MELTLKSGVKITYEKPNFEHYAEIWDESLEYLNRQVPLSLGVCGKLMIYCGITTMKELDDQKYKRDEIYEIGALLMSEIYNLESTKKK